MTLCALAATESKVMLCGYSRFRGVPGVGSYVNNECLHCRNYPLNRIFVRCHISDRHTRQVSGYEGCLNFISDR